MSNIDKYAKSLNGIRYLEWIKLKIALDRIFEQKKRESEKEFQLSTEEIEQSIHQQFG